MKHTGILAVCGAFALLALCGSPWGSAIWAPEAFADGGRAGPVKSRHRARRGTRVRGFLLRGGYYSYIDPDVINTYTGTRYLGIFRDPKGERQGGPFDSGFFFDSGIGPPWNDSPYPR